MGGAIQMSMALYAVDILAKSSVSSLLLAVLRALLIGAEYSGMPIKPRRDKGGVLWRLGSIINMELGEKPWGRRRCISLSFRSSSVAPSSPPFQTANG
mmetsp:Transcript_34762/g.137066  ORF Transcript_34762/g.137066 Transcript_34762/m.137066 type:complete len:98 (-) Transcript_34762:385-678(-)